MAHDGRARDALPLGIVMDLTFPRRGTNGTFGENSDDPDLRVAAARLERFVGNKPIPARVGRRWGQEAARSLHREIRSNGAEAESSLQRPSRCAVEYERWRAEPGR